MRKILTVIATIISFTAFGQDLSHQFTDSKDSVNLKGLKILLEIDSVYKISDSTGVRFALEIINNGPNVLKLTNPLYDTELNINPSFWLLPSKREIRLKEVGRWPDPKYAKKIKPYRLDRVVSSGKEIPPNEFTTFWEMDTLIIKPRQTVRYELNLFEQVLINEKNEPYITALEKGNYFVIFNVSLDVGNYYIRSKPLRFKMRLY